MIRDLGRLLNLLREEGRSNTRLLLLDHDSDETLHWLKGRGKVRKIEFEESEVSLNSFFSPFFAREC